MFSHFIQELYNLNIWIPRSGKTYLLEKSSHTLQERWETFPCRSALGLCVSYPKRYITHDLELPINKVYNETQRAISSVITVAGIVPLYSIIRGAKVRKSLLINWNHMSSYYKIHKTKKFMILAKYLFVHSN